ncbi:MAG: hypothetical protein L0Y72_29295 [Gemmataceae bacterium]|nr:hypothetical protein [Gemmataceae bacterium]MCI0743144.1 hypothetical protein [Gemmataceae bacterium]
MELFAFFRDTLAWIATITVLLPLNIPMLALAYRIQNGPKPLDMEPAELWSRAGGAGVCLAALCAAFVYLDYLLADAAELPPGPIHLLILFGYVPAAVWIVFVFFAYSDLFDALSVLVIDLGLPIFVLFFLNAIFGLWKWALNFAYDWLKEPLAT